MKDVENRIAVIRSDRIRGASEMAAEALAVLKDTALVCPAENPVELWLQLSDIALRLSVIRPSICAIHTAVSRFMYGLKSNVLNAATIAEARHLTASRARDAIRAASAAKDQAARHASALLFPGAQLLTASYSSTVIQTLETAYDQKVFLHVDVLASQSGSLAYGERTLRKLGHLGFPCRLIADQELESAVDQADLILIGADAFLSDSSLVNGFPSLALAEAAAAHSRFIPLYAVFESVKFGNSLPEEIEPGLEQVPANLVSGIATDDGFFSGDDIAKYVNKLRRAIPPLSSFTAI